jgi:hypothetical protein
MRKLASRSVTSVLPRSTVRATSIAVPASSLSPSAASSGAGLRDLMARMGHDSERAAMIHQHEARGADQAITSAIDTSNSHYQLGNLYRSGRHMA